MKVGFRLAVRNEIFPTISVNKDVTVIVVLQRERVSPMGTQEEWEPSDHTSSYGKPVGKEAQDVETQATVLDSSEPRLASSHTQKSTKFLNLVYLVFFN